MTGLTAAEPHHWAPIPELVQWLANRILPHAKVLEIGPGHAPFPRATAFVDYNPENISDLGIRAKTAKVDVSREPLPFPDKSFDFIYARHVLEDSWNPFHICQEMSRVGKSGYIETPSPMAEVTRGTDGGAPQWRGYHHHHWVIWEQSRMLAFVAKYPLIEALSDRVDSGTAAVLRQGPKYWNTYHLWSDRIVLKHFQSPLDFDIQRGYANVLAIACEMSKNATDRFFEGMQAAKAA